MVILICIDIESDFSSFIFISRRIINIKIQIRNFYCSILLNERIKSFAQEIKSIGNNFMDRAVLPFAKANFSNIQIFNFENKITIPSFEDLKNYWMSNTYHKPEYNSEFEKHAKDLIEIVDESLRAT